jgi:ribosomal protein S18 acetylase RimI-like enzyme
MAMGNPTEDALNRLICGTYASDRRTLYIAESDGGPIGIVGVERQPDSTDAICHIAVDPSNRGVGIGRRLIEHVAASTDGSRLVAETDVGAVDFYRACGFEIKSLGEKYPGVERFECTRRGPANPARDP